MKANCSYKIYKNLLEASHDEGFTNRFMYGAFANRLYATNEYIYDRRNEVRYNKRRQNQKPTKMSNSEIMLIWELVDKDISLHILRQGS